MRRRRDLRLSILHLDEAEPVARGIGEDREDHDTRHLRPRPHYRAAIRYDLGERSGHVLDTEEDHGLVCRLAAVLAFLQKTARQRGDDRKLQALLCLEMSCTDVPVEHRLVESGQLRKVRARNIILNFMGGLLSYGALRPAAKKPTFLRR